MYTQKLLLGSGGANRLVPVSGGNYGKQNTNQNGAQFRTNALLDIITTGESLTVSLTKMDH
jgi:hypothetical protein